MKFKKISEKEKEFEFELEDETHTFSGILLEELLNDKDVEMAQYNISHPLIGKPAFYVKTKKGKPREAVVKALKSIQAKTKKIM